MPDPSSGTGGRVGGSVSGYRPRHQPRLPALLPMGFTRQRRLRRPGALLPHHFALTARVPCGTERGGMFLWHYPSGCPARLLAGIAARRSPDFPLPNPGRKGSGHPDDFGIYYGTLRGFLRHREFYHYARPRVNPLTCR